MLTAKLRFLSAGPTSHTEPNVPALLRQHEAASQSTKGHEHASLLADISNAHAEEIARKLSSALNLIELGEVADPYVQPMLIYYGCEQLLGAFSRALLRWMGDRRSHGLTTVAARRIEDTSVKIEEAGFFHRVANTFAAFTGYYNVFSSRDANQVPVVDYALGKLANPPPAPILLPTKPRLGDLITHDPVRIASPSPDLMKQQREPPYDVTTNAMLVDVLIVFIAGHLCRYDPLTWRTVLEGRNTPIRIDFENALERVSTYLVDGVIAWLMGERRFDTGLHNPYPALGRWSPRLGA